MNWTEDSKKLLLNKTAFNCYQQWHVGSLAHLPTMTEEKKHVPTTTLGAEKNIAKSSLFNSGHFVSTPRLPVLLLYNDKLLQVCTLGTPAPLAWRSQDRKHACMESFCRRSGLVSGTCRSSGSSGSSPSFQPGSPATGCPMQMCLCQRVMTEITSNFFWAKKDQ